MVGLKRESHESFMWTTDGRVRLSSAEISDDVRIAIHPCFWRTLGICDIRRPNHQENPRPRSMRVPA
jgi:hypothetical protein